MPFQLFQLPKQIPLASTAVVSGGKLQFYKAGTTTPQAIYSDAALTTQHSNPVVADSAGVFEPIYLDADLEYRVQLKTSTDVLVYDIDDINDADFRAPYYPQTTAESNAGVTPTNFRYVEGHPKRYGAEIDDSTDDYTAFANAVAVCEQANIFMPRWAGTARLSQKLTVTSTIIRGYGGHISLTALKGTATSDDVVLIAGRSAGLENIRVSATSNRRSNGSYTDGGVKIRPATGTSISRIVMRDVYITEQPGYGCDTAGNLEHIDWDRVTAESCKGHPFIWDDGTYESDVVGVGARPFQCTFGPTRALHCGGNILIGTSGQGTSPFQNRFVELESLSCAFDSNIRVGTDQVVVRSQNTVLDRPDIEDQFFDQSTDNLGYSRTALGSPTSGISVITQDCEIYKPYFSQLTKSIDVDSASDGCSIVDPQIIASGTQQTVGITVGATTGFYLRANTAKTSGATTLLQYSGTEADIVIDGKRHLGLATTDGDFEINADGSETLTISAGTAPQLLADFVTLAAESGTTDDVDRVTFAGARDGLPLIKFQADAGDTITVNDGASASGDNVNFSLGAGSRILVGDDGDVLVCLYIATANTLQEVAFLEP